MSSFFSPLFSIIIPCYNSASYISRVFTSVKKQSYKNYEIIFINDKSDDDTLNVLLSYKNERVIIINNDSNLGPAKSRNIGLKIAKGDYIIFIDSDDWIENELLQILFEKILIEKADIIFYDSFRAYSDENKKNINRSKIYLQSKDISWFIANSTGSLCCMCTKRELWEGLEIPSLRNAEDIAIIPILISKSTIISVLPIPLYNYFYRNNSLSNVKNEDISISFIKSFNYTFSHIPKKFSSEIEFHGIKTIMYGATLNSIQSGFSKNSIEKITSTFVEKYPKWYSNKYIIYLPKYKRIYLYFLNKKRYSFLYLYKYMHQISLQFLKI
jgi:glycosyltransferase involved in cell wall biosynthesis